VRALALAIALLACASTRASADDAAPTTVLAPIAAEPRAFLPDRDRCHRYPGVRSPVCDGPRRVPEPTAEASERAARLGLGVHATADTLVVRAPLPEWVAEVGGRARDGLLWPVANGLLSRRFGAERIHDESSGTHPGVDIVAGEGTLLRAVDDALVAYADNGIRGMGNALFLVHADGSVSIYAHCRALRVSAGELVERGAIVGELGRTGLTARAHLHYEWRVRGVPRDPMSRFVERPSWPLRIEAEDGEVTWIAPPANTIAPPPLESDQVVQGSSASMQVMNSTASGPSYTHP
jgi:murein DD-endopeptidase MepM/ murein hydrolase activator NlpD